MSCMPSSPAECFASISGQVLKDFEGCPHQLCHVGSSTLEGLRSGDIDGAVWFPYTEPPDILAKARSTGWRQGPTYPEDGWESLRKRDFNLLVCWTEEAYQCWSAYGYTLTRLAAVNPYPFHDKQLRIALCDAVFNIIQRR